jgi:VanZ family protein
VHKGKLLGIGFISWMVAITVLSLVSIDEGTSLGIEIPHFDKFVHFTFYFVAGILGMLFGLTLRKDFTGNFYVVLKFLLGLIGYGIIIEVLQGSLTTYRSAEGLDILANSAGALSGILLMWAVFSAKTGSKGKN